LIDGEAAKVAREATAAGIGAEQARSIAQEFAWLMGRTDDHPGEVPIHAEARAIIDAGRKRRGEIGEFSATDNVPRGQDNRPLAVDSEAYKIIQAGRRRRSEID
jgi:hypothetical protein